MNISTQNADQPADVRGLDDWMITGGADCRVCVWDLRSPFDEDGSERRGRSSDVDPKPKFTLEVSSAVLCMDFCPRAPRFVAVGTESGEVDLFDLLAVGVRRREIMARERERTSWC